MSTTTVPAATTHGAEAGAATTSGAWRDFVAGPWCDAIDVRDFIQRNYTEYTGDSSFLAGATERTTGIWAKLTAMFPEERAKGIYDVDTHIPGTITSHAPISSPTAAACSGPAPPDASIAKSRGSSPRWTVARRTICAMLATAMSMIA